MSTIFFLGFFLRGFFDKSTTDSAGSETEYWETTLKTEAEIRRELIDNGRTVEKQLEFELSWLADGLDTRKQVGTLVANYGVCLIAPALSELPHSECEIKYQRAVKITERIVTLGCSDKDDLPYFVA